ncbi:hypothetical protein BmR1_04g06565 [Babesia microti strain RI]|uniref:Uncharacterized protein n=1 Tax=Babesia microti (strain RI) TaxID=1133968 RepID=A0A1N6LXR6_BABMR|nr:hypothetical protein BmR1_04g06565 [Babesia microti strain RI]SIO73670.1 hypothetical protein BmR1_04g06565 [Babesia microti strain RI]|eukprot:XP_021337742.1 hypothetical protein BmR1_04g06565 [Babesia microti strain RI]
MFETRYYAIISQIYVIFHLIALTYCEIVTDDYVSHYNIKNTSNLNHLDGFKGQGNTPYPNPEKFDYPEKKLETLTRDLEAAAINNPYYKIPSYDHKIRKMSEAHELLFRSLGVYVIHDEHEDEDSELESQDLDDSSFDKLNISGNKSIHPYDMFEKSELLDAMTPEEKLHYIPKLKDAISREIAMQKDRLERIRDKFISQSNI